MKYNTIGLAPISDIDAKMLNPLQLAYIGDAVIDLFVRDYVIKNNIGNVNKLHLATTKVVNASAQALFAKKIMDSLSEDELHIFKRGRNSKSGMQPKNCSTADYRLATGLEALFGYIYISGKFERLNELLTSLYEAFFKSDQ